MQSQKILNQGVASVFDTMPLVVCDQVRSFCENYTRKELAALWRVSLTSLSLWLKKHNISHKKGGRRITITEDLKNYCETHTQSEIAIYLDMPQSSVCLFLQRHNLSFKKKSKFPDITEEIKKYCKGKTRKELSDEWGIGTSYLIAWLKTNEIETRRLRQKPLSKN
jgi:hypothetical protein